MSKSKDPADRLDYVFDWNVPDTKTGLTWLESGETITAHTLTLVPPYAVAGDLEVESSSHAGGKTVVYWLKGGIDETRVKVTCHIITSAGREADHTETIQLKQH